MVTITTHNIQLISLVVLFVVIVIFLFLIIFKRSRKEILISPKDTLDLKRNSLSQNRAIFVDLSPKSANVVELAVEIWRIENRLSKTTDNLSEIQKRGLESSIQKLLKYLDEFDIKIIDHTNEKYNEGMNVSVLSFEKDPSIKVPMIKETIEPTIICKGLVVKKGKVVVISN